MKNNIDDSVNLCSPSLSVSESGNEELCSELSPVLDERSRRSLRCCVDGVSDNSPLPARYQTTGERSPYDDSPYMFSNHQTNEQPDCSGSDCLQQSFPDGKPGRGLPPIDDTTEKSGVNKNKVSGSDKQSDRNVEIIDINMEVEQWYSIANLVYVLLVGYVWVRHMMGSPASGNVLRLIDSIFIWMVLWIPHAVKVEPLKAKLLIWFVWLAAIAALFALAIVGVAR